MQKLTTKLQIKVSPGAAANAITGWMGDQLKIRVTAVPEKGKANQAVIKLLSRTLGLHTDAIKISKGSTSGKKIVEITGMSPGELRRRLSQESVRATSN